MTTDPTRPASPTIPMSGPVTGAPEDAGPAAPPHGGATGSPRPPGPATPDTHAAPPATRSTIARRAVAIALIALGLALLGLTLFSQDAGLSSTEGASWTQVVVGVAGTVVLVTGLALIAQAFETSDEPPSP